MHRYLLAVAAILSFPLGAQAEVDYVRIARDNAPAVVAINVAKKDGSTFTGTGFILTPDGLIATSRHVSQDALYMNITFYNGVVSGEAVVVAEASLVDAALLKIQAKQLPTVHIVPAGDVRPGQPITVIGNPRRLQNTISSGLISQVRQKADGIIWHQISAPISPSSSGSPVFNEAGDVISMAFASYSGENNQNLNFAVPSDYIIQLAQEAGFSLAPTSPDAAQPSNENAFVRHIKKSWASLRRLLSFIGL